MTTGLQFGCSLERSLELSHQHDLPAALADQSIVIEHSSRSETKLKASTEQDCLPTQTRTYLVGKSLVDLSFALFLLPMAVLLMGFIGIAIALSSRSPVMFRQQRIGRYRRPFTIWKFRTMHPDGERILSDHLMCNPQASLESDSHHKLRDNPRITPFGKLLRETSLDELPQILNILAGDMSFVGPRPIVRKEIVKYGERLPYYLSAKPGITGLWQVSGRCNNSYDSRVILDEVYVRQWTMLRDLRILLKTPRAVFSREGAC